MTTINTVTWDTLISTFIQTGCAATVKRKLRELGNKRWDKLKQLPIATTTGCDFLNLLHSGGTKTKVYLGTLQNLAIEMGPLTHPVLPKRLWPNVRRIKINSRSLPMNSALCCDANIFSEATWVTQPSVNVQLHPCPLNATAVQTVK